MNPLTGKNYDTAILLSLEFILLIVIKENGI